MVSDWSLIIDIGKHFMQGSKFGPQRTSNVVGSIWPPGQTDSVTDTGKCKLVFVSKETGIWKKAG